MSNRTDCMIPVTEGIHRCNACILRLNKLPIQEFYAYAYKENKHYLADFKLNHSDKRVKIAEMESRQKELATLFENKS